MAPTGQSSAPLARHSRDDQPCLLYLLAHVIALTKVPQVQAASGHPAPYSVTQYCRAGAEEDPWLSVEEHPSQVLYGEGSFNVPAWCDSRGQLAPDLSEHPEVLQIGTVNGVVRRCLCLVVPLPSWGKRLGWTAPKR